MNDPRSEFERLTKALLAKASGAADAQSAQQDAAAEARFQFDQKVLEVLKPTTNELRPQFTALGLHVGEFGGVGQTHYTIAWSAGSVPAQPYLHPLVRVDIGHSTTHVTISWKEGSTDKKTELPLAELQANDMISAVNAVLAYQLRAP